MIDHLNRKSALGLLFALSSIAAIVPRSADAAVELIVNGSFEADSVAGDVSQMRVLSSGSSLTGWVVQSHPVAGPTSSIDLLYSSGSGADSNPYVVGPAADGVQFIDLVGTPWPGQTGPGQISQTFATTVGQEYTLSFSFANNYDGYNPEVINGISALVSLTGVDLVNPTLTHTTSAEGDLDWTFWSETFVATSTETTLTFQDTSTYYGSNLDAAYFGILLDGVSVTATTYANPEASSLIVWSMLALVGAAAVKVRTRRASC